MISNKIAPYDIEQGILEEFALWKADPNAYMKVHPEVMCEVFKPMLGPSNLDSFSGTIFAPDPKVMRGIADRIGKATGWAIMVVEELGGGCRPVVMYRADEPNDQQKKAMEGHYHAYQ